MTAKRGLFFINAMLAVCVPEKKNTLFFKVMPSNITHTSRLMFMIAMRQLALGVVVAGLIIIATYLGISVGVFDNMQQISFMPLVIGVATSIALSLHFLLTNAQSKQAMLLSLIHI